MTVLNLNHEIWLSSAGGGLSQALASTSVPGGVTDSSFVLQKFTTTDCGCSQVRIQIICTLSIWYHFLFCDCVVCQRFALVSKFNVTQAKLIFYCSGKWLRNWSIQTKFGEISFWQRKKCFRSGSVRSALYGLLSKLFFSFLTMASLWLQRFWSWK